MLNRPIDKISVTDIQQLVDNGVAEGRTIEYKETLPGGTDSEKKEFLADISSLANATGGDVVYGIEEKREGGKPTGILANVKGLSIANRDAETQRLESMMKDGIAPRIPGVRLQWIEGFSAGPVLVIRVPRSWAGPHMVTYQQHSRFYARNSSGKYVLDVFELRNAFLNSGSLSERAREFRAERLGRIAAGDAPVQLFGDKLVCIHVLPHVSLAGAVGVDVQDVADQHDMVSPFGSSGFNRTFNIDGLLTHDPSSNGTSSSYLQLFRTGVIESVDAALMSPIAGYEAGLPSTAFRDRFIPFLSQVFTLLRKIEIEPPVSILVSLTGTRGLKLFTPHVIGPMVVRASRAFDRDTILLPDLLIQDFSVDRSIAIRPMLDALWQAAGYANCQELQT